MYGDLQQNTETRRIPVGQISYSSMGGVALFNGIAQIMQHSQTCSQESFCDADKWSSSKNDGQDFLTPVPAVTTASMKVSPPCDRSLR